MTLQMWYSPLTTSPGTPTLTATLTTPPGSASTEPCPVCTKDPSAGPTHWALCENHERPIIWRWASTTSLIIR